MLFVLKNLLDQPCHGSNADILAGPERCMFSLINPVNLELII